MKQKLIVFYLLISITVLFFSAGNPCAASDNGKTAYVTFCSGCHPQGGNPQNPAKTLLKMDREANGIKGVKDIIRKMRKPGSGMRQFDKKDIPNNTAKAIAEYIINTFK